LLLRLSAVRIKVPEWILLQISLCGQFSVFLPESL
jgi:hypothetical protein